MDKSVMSSLDHAADQSVDRSIENYVVRLDSVGVHDGRRVGGKNASLGEMLQNLGESGVRVPAGYATLTKAYSDFLSRRGLDTRIHTVLDDLDTANVHDLMSAGAHIREWIMAEPFCQDFEAAIVTAYRQLCGGDDEIPVAVRSSATAEDLPDASFAGQQETFLNIRGADNVVHAVREVFASLFSDRAIAYRVHNGFDHREIALSAGIQRMVRSETSVSGVMFTLDTESGFDGAVLITASYGLGETVVQGAVNPDEYLVHKEGVQKGFPAILRRSLGSKAIKMMYTDSGIAGRSVESMDVDLADRNLFCLKDDDLVTLANQAMKIEQHYGSPMDIEWARDGDDGELYIVQARPETVQSRSGNKLERYRLLEHQEPLVEGRSIGQRIGQGATRVISDPNDMMSFQEGDVLVTDMTDPDWEPVMKKSSAIVTNRGGRTCHAAIIAREMGIPAVVGCGNATRVLQSGKNITVSCAEGDTGYVYAGLLNFEHRIRDLQYMPEIPIKLMMNVASPERAFSFSTLPNAGIGLARLEFIINKMIGVHPKALLNYHSLTDDLKRPIAEHMVGYESPVSFYVEKLVEGIATIAAAFNQGRVIVRLSDFKSNEYRNLLGGSLFEPTEENPMLGFRGASRYIADSFADCFELECIALKKVRDVLGFHNVEVMVPFVRTPEEARQVIGQMERFGLTRGENGLRVIMMCEVPSNALQADEFLQYFDGMSIGSNDLTQLTLGLDRDSERVASLFDERNDAVKQLMSMAIRACHAQRKSIGICGQGPSDHPELTQWLIEQGVDSISLNPDTIIETWLALSDRINNA